jgi:hypothetical protein
MVTASEHSDVVWVHSFDEYLSGSSTLQLSLLHDRLLSPEAQIVAG